MNTEHTIWKPF